MLKRLPLAVLAAAIFAVSGSVTILAAGAPAIADQDDHHARPHHHANHGVNPYGPNGYWSHGAWHNRLANHPMHPKHPRHPDRDRH